MQKLRPYFFRTVEGRNMTWNAYDLHDLMVRVTERGHIPRYVEDATEYKARTGEELTL